MVMAMAMIQRTQTKREGHKKKSLTVKSLVALVCTTQWRLMSRRKHYSISLYFATVLYFANQLQSRFRMCCNCDISKLECVEMATFEIRKRLLGDPVKNLKCCNLNTFEISTATDQRHKVQWRHMSNLLIILLQHMLPMRCTNEQAYRTACKGNSPKMKGAKKAVFDDFFSSKYH